MCMRVARQGSGVDNFIQRRTVARWLSGAILGPDSHSEESTYDAMELVTQASKLLVVELEIDSKTCISTDNGFRPGCSPGLVSWPMELMNFYLCILYSSGT